jgi:hypothetical protein
MGWMRMATAALAAAICAAPAAAQSPGYGGGRLPSAAVPRAGYVPTLGIALQPRGDRMALRFDTSLRCGRTSYDIVGRTLAAFDGRIFNASAARRLRIPGGRIDYAWTLAGQADGTIASGTLRITGTRVAGGRTTGCDRKPSRRFNARIAAPAPAGAPRPPGGAAYGGLSAIRVADGLRAPVILKATSSGRRVAARWTALARCGRSPRAELVNFTPSMRIGARGGFSRAERFAVRYSDALARYRVRFAGRVSGEGARGTLRMRVRVFTRSGGRLLTRCDTRTRAWTAGLLRTLPPTPGTTPPPPGTPTPAPTPTPTPQPRTPIPGEWSLNMTSDPTDYIGQGRTWSHGPPADRVSASGTRQLVSFHIETADQTNGGWWDTEFAAPPGGQLAAGASYEARRYPFNDGAAGFAHGGMGRGCNTLTATFTIHELTFDPDGTLRNFRADFEQHCEGGEAALRGTWVFRAA